MPASSAQSTLALFKHELRSLVRSPALLLALVVATLLMAYSFNMALELFMRASRTAVLHPELASAMNPHRGIFVPTFGAAYLVETLLLPFVAIAMIAQDKASGALKLLLQLPFSPQQLLLTKLSALFTAGGLFLVPVMGILFYWSLLGGHVYKPELLCLFLGHALYALTVICIAFFAASVSRTLPTAAIISLAVVLGCWVLDFAALGNGAWTEFYKQLSLTSLLRSFEGGLLNAASLASFLGLATLFFTGALYWIHPGYSMNHRFRIVLPGLVVALGLIGAGLNVTAQWDLSEDQRYSFNPADASALRQMEQPLKITIHLSPEDSRLVDYKLEILSRLRPLVTRLEVCYTQTVSADLYIASTSDDYGLIEYEYAGNHDQSYSTSPEEVLTILHQLAGASIEQEVKEPYPGYPLVAESTGNKWGLILILPLLILTALVSLNRMIRIRPNTGETKT